MKTRYSLIFPLPLALPSPCRPSPYRSMPQTPGTPLTAGMAGSAFLRLASGARATLILSLTQSEQPVPAVRDPGETSSERGRIQRVNLQPFALSSCAIRTAVMGPVLKPVQDILLRERYSLRPFPVEGGFYQPQGKVVAQTRSQTTSSAKNG